MSGDSRPMSRRRMLERASSGFGMLALAGLLDQEALLAAPPAVRPARRSPPRAQSVILCYMSGGISQVDSFDPKPRLAAEAGEPMPVRIERTQFNNNGRIFPSPFEFRKCGRSGIDISSMFPLLRECADEMAVVRSMVSPFNEHAQGNFFLHSGFPFLGHPSAGAWVSYGLGSANRNLPAYVVLESGNAVPPHGGVGLYGSGFLPARHQASILQADAREAVDDLSPGQPPSLQRSRLDLVGRLDRAFLADIRGHGDVEAAIGNYETAYRMQSEIPELCDIGGEPESVRRLYGIDEGDTQLAAYGRQALLARRLVEKGVRFIELSCLTENVGAGGAPNPWDQHGDLERGHRAMAHQVDRPIAALIRDLRSRGLLDQTLIVFTGEFGRTPFSQGSNGRDHNPYGFSLWMAGGGIRGGSILGATDDYGYHVEGPRTTVYDLWATVLHQLGIDHRLLVYRYAGRDVRLTDVHGRVLHGVLA